MQKIDFVYGNEERFDSFIKSLKNARKVGLISHTDLDGISAAKIVNEFVKTNYIRFVNYKDLNNNLIEEIKKEEFSHIIITDLFVKEDSFFAEISKDSEVLVIDHHLTPKDYNSEKVYFLNAADKGLCATYMSYLLFSRVVDLNNFEWLVVCACIADVCYRKNTEWMQEMYTKYNSGTFDPDNIKQGRFWDQAWTLCLAVIYFESKEDELFKLFNADFNLDSIRKYADPVQKEFEDLKKNFVNQRMEVYDGYFWEVQPKFALKSLISSWLSLDEYPDKTIIIGSFYNNLYNISYRRQDGKYDLNVLSRKLTEGFENCSAGGHKKASGSFIQIKDVAIFKERLKNLKNYI